MLTTRHAALAIMLMTIATQPALAETCNLTLNGRPLLEDAACTVTSRGRIVSTDQGETITIEIRRSILRADIAENRHLSWHRDKHYGLRSFGRVVKSNDLDDKTCFFNQHITLCIDR